MDLGVDGFLPGQPTPVSVFQKTDSAAFPWFRSRRYRSVCPPDTSKVISRKSRNTDDYLCSRGSRVCVVHTPAHAPYLAYVNSPRLPALEPEQGRSGRGSALLDAEAAFFGLLFTFTVGCRFSGCIKRFHCSRQFSCCSCRISGLERFIVSTDYCQLAVNSDADR